MHLYIIHVCVCYFYWAECLLTEETLCVLCGVFELLVHPTECLLAVGMVHFIETLSNSLLNPVAQP